MTGWIAVAGRDVQPEYPYWINPTTVATARYWDDPTGRVVTLELVDGRKVHLRERAALDHVGRLIGGSQPPEPDPEPIAASACSVPRRRLGVRASR